MINNQSDYLNKIYNISQVSLLLGEKPATIRYWLKRFSLLNFKKYDNGRCFFYFDHILILLNIQYHLKELAYKIEGVQKQIRKIGIKAFKEQAKTNYKYENIIDNLQNNVLINGSLKSNIISVEDQNSPSIFTDKTSLLQSHSNNNYPAHHTMNSLRNNEEISNIIKEIQTLENLFKNKS